MKKQYSTQEAKQKIKQYFIQAHTCATNECVTKGCATNELHKEKILTEIKALIKKARTLAMKHRIKLPKELKRQYCAHCYTLFIPGKNYRVRTTEGKVVYTCLSCCKYTRFSYTAQQKIKRDKKIQQKITQKIQ